jgi:hypothetical protein
VEYKNLTLTIRPEVLREARKIALDRNTSVNAMVRDFLTAVVDEHAKDANLARMRKAAAEELKEMFRTLRVDPGPITWTRGELHER